MARSLSLDIRERVVALVGEGVSCREAARRLRISAASAVRIMQFTRWLDRLHHAREGAPGAVANLMRLRRSSAARSRPDPT